LWLTTTLQLKSDTPFTSLFPMLDDGTVLCRLVETISTNIKITLRTTASENIQQALNGLLVLGMDRSQMFSVEDLLEHKNIKRISNCLFHIAKIAFKYGIEPPARLKETLELGNSGGNIGGGNGSGGGGEIFNFNLENGESEGEIKVESANDESGGGANQGLGLGLGLSGSEMDANETEGMENNEGNDNEGDENDDQLLPRMVSMLKQGATMNKLSNTGKPQRKKVYGSEGILEGSNDRKLERLCWVDVPSPSPVPLPSPSPDASNSIRFSEIVQLVEGKKSKTFQMVPSLVDDELCFSIVTQQRSLDFIAPTRRLRRLWLKGIGLIIQQLPSSVKLIRSSSVGSPINTTTLDHRPTDKVEIILEKISQLLKKESEDLAGKMKQIETQLLTMQKQVEVLRDKQKKDKEEKDQYFQTKTQRKRCRCIC